jgi:lipoprotein-releasing system ATP-binding protein
MDKCLQMRDVYKSYSKAGVDIQVLRGACVEIHQGDQVSVVGQSGAGKSTFLHVLGTLDAPDRGDVLFEGESLTGRSSSALAHFRNHMLGFVFQFHHLLSEFTALENVMMPCLIRRHSREEAAEKARRSLDAVGLGHRLHHIPGELSGGEQQRVALARALVLDPPLLLADEVTGNLDERTGNDIHALLFEVNRNRGVTLVVVTHNTHLADRMGRRLVLEEGLLKDRN